jgi:hypothetical protein
MRASLQPPLQAVYIELLYIHRLWRACTTLNGSGPGDLQDDAVLISDSESVGDNSDNSDDTNPTLVSRYQTSF